MIANPVKFRFEKTIQAPASHVYRAFTNAMALREWLCDAASVQPRPGRRIFLAWNSGYYVSGDYLNLVENKEVSFKSRGRNEPGPTEVHVSIFSDGAKSILTLEHAGLLDNEIWATARHEIHWGWEKGLVNLASVLETGEDLRVTQRPMLGIYVGELNEQVATRLGVPTTAGFRLQGVVEGMGAQAAGLQTDDVIIAMHGRPTSDYVAFQHAISSCKAGDRVEVVFYRGAEKKTVMMELSRRHIPEIPPTAEELAKKLQALFVDQQKEIRTVLKGINDEQAAFRPAEDAWNILEVLAHLIHGERDIQQTINDRIFGQERVSDDFSDNPPCRVQATVKAYPGLKNMLLEFQRSQTETVELVASLPATFTQHKGSYWRLAFELQQYPQHTSEHIAQIKTLASPRG